ncbi:hypothetical protein [Thioalkalivibrio paradoxus]|uniref:Elongation factor-1 alpha n=1 Tax=Thioalkalivibrio paradoxus ARh 1 TaxID=713585 RepID=W0DJE6_9GAMM|nr:hypothetical protein [Thioalkalivibrio paradoxus]AHE97123.1 Elongation factor-1 alpha [Thioalkalivibrio paradoxus ARh 1]
MNTIPVPDLPRLPLPVRVLFTGYLLAVGVGLLIAGAQIMLTHGMADGKPGLSIDDIVYSYHGNRTNTRLESALNGSMQGYAPDEERRTLIDWARRGAPASDWEPTIQPIVQQHCVACHSTTPGLADFNRLANLQERADIDTGPSIASLTRVSHIHLFGITMLFFGVGLIFAFARGFDPIFKSLLIAAPFAFLILDVAAWWLTKWQPGFGWLVMFGGFGYSVASTVMIFTSLYQMWLLRVPATEARWDVMPTGQGSSQR